MCNWNLCLTFQKGLEAANLEGLETAEVLEATAGLEVEANLEVLESVVETNLEGLEAVVGTNLEVPAVASTWRRSAWRAQRRRPGGPGGGGSSSSKAKLFSSAS